MLLESVVVAVKKSERLINIFHSEDDVVDGKVNSCS